MNTVRFTCGDVNFLDGNDLEIMVVNVLLIVFALAHSFLLIKYFISVIKTFKNISRACEL